VRQDVLLLGIMMVLAACGLIYEYLLSHYAGRILGMMEATIYGMIGLMIVAMGLGAWAAKWCKNPYTTFAWLEAAIAFLGCSSILVIAGAIAFTQKLPDLIAANYTLPPDVVLQGGPIEQLQTFSTYLPYVFGFVLGVLIGMEIPLIARVREHVYGKHLENNVGTIYGADYIGAGIGALVWIYFMLSMEITKAAVWTALLNVIAGTIFLWRYWASIIKPGLLLMVHLLLFAMLIVIADSGARWMTHLASVLYTDQVTYQTQTRFQHITFTERSYGSQGRALDMYLNGRLQFSSLDEQIYHGMLVYPAMMSVARAGRILVIGGGDGLAVRDILRFSPETVHLIDLDAQLVSLFSSKYALPDEVHSQAPMLTGVNAETAFGATSSVKVSALRERLMALNEHAFEDPRVTVSFADAFIEVDNLLENQMRFDAVIIDLPDPSHPDLNRLYSDHFYGRLRRLLMGDGVIAVQSTSPFHAREAFISIGKTLEAAGFAHVEQYRQNIPSFGEWGWSIATLNGAPASVRIARQPELSFSHPHVNKAVLLGAFAMPSSLYRDRSSIRVNHLGTGTVYQYHAQAWQSEVGITMPSASGQP
jgi:spermidine synthase